MCEFFTLDIVYLSKIIIFMPNKLSIMDEKMSNKVKLTCPCCNNQFWIHEIKKETPVIAVETDYRSYSETHDPLPHSITNCPYCFYCNDIFDLAPKDKAKLVVEQGFHLHELPSKEIFPSVKYYIKGQILEKTEESSYFIAQEYLKASWMARRELNHELENFFQQKTIEKFEKFIRDENPDDKRKAKCHYLLCELSRRIKDYQKAFRYFDIVKKEKLHFGEAKQILPLIENKFSGISFFENMELTTKQMLEIFNDQSFLEMSKSYKMSDKDESEKEVVDVASYVYV